MPAWAQTTGNEFLGIEESGGEIRVYVKKTQK
jgi:TusA-related sulfurtransferase